MSEVFLNNIGTPMNAASRHQNIVDCFAAIEGIRRLFQFNITSENLNILLHQKRDERKNAI